MVKYKNSQTKITNVFFNYSFKLIKLFGLLFVPMLVYCPEERFNIFIILSVAIIILGIFSFLCMRGCIPLNEKSEIIKKKNNKKGRK